MRTAKLDRFFAIHKKEHVSEIPDSAKKTMFTKTFEIYQTPDDRRYIKENGNFYKFVIN